MTNATISRLGVVNVVNPSNWDKDKKLTVKEVAKVATATITRDNFGAIQFSDGVKTVTFNESEAAVSISSGVCWRRLCN